MADRVVKITIAAQVNSYLSDMDRVAAKTRENRTEAEKLTAKLEAQQRAFTVAGRTMLAAGGVIAAGLLLAVKRAADFDQAMSNVQAATHESADNMRSLRDAAIDAGASTVFSAKESAGAIEELAKAGLSTKAIIGGGLKGALDLAAAGSMEVADAAGVASTTLQQFGLSGDRASHVADVLAAGAGKAMGDVSDLSQALKQSGTVAAQFGLSLEETTGSLAAFASKGLLGSDAGTSLRTMLLRLANPTGEAAAKMKELGIQAYDAQGNFVGMTGLAGQLEKGLSGLTQEQRNAALAIVFGQDAIRAANILYTEGARGIAKWTQEVDDAGYAAETAEMRLDNLAGDLEKLSGAFDSALISMGSSAQGPLRLVVQGLTDVVDGFNDMPEGAQAAVFWVGAVASAVLLGGGAFLVAVPKVAAYKLAVAELGPLAQRADTAVRGLSRALGAVAIASVAIAGIDALADAISKGLLPSLEQTSDKTRTAASGVELLRSALEARGLVNSAEAAKQQLSELGDVLDRMSSRQWFDGPILSDTVDTIAQIGKQLGSLAKSDLPAAQAQFRQLSVDANLTREQQIAFIQNNADFRDALLASGEATGGATDAQKLLNAALGVGKPAIADVADEAAIAEQNLTGMKDALSEVGETALGMSSAVDQAQGALNDLAEAAKAEGVAIDGTNDESIAFRDAIRDVEQSHRDAATAILENGGTLDEAKLKYQQGRQAVIDMLIAKGMDSAAAVLWADTNLGSAAEVEAGIRDLSAEINRMPTKKTVQLVADTSPALATINQFVFDNNGRRINFYVDGYVGRQVAGSSLINVARAAGGIIPGAPSNTDNMLAAVASGEFVVRASQVVPPENRRVLEYINAGGRMRGYADGGFVQPQYAQQMPFYRGDSYAPVAQAGRADVTLIVNNPVAHDVVDDTRAAAATVRASGLVG